MQKGARIRRGKYLLTGETDRPEIIIGQPIIIYKKPDTEKQIKMSMHMSSKRKFNRRSRSYVTPGAFGNNNDMTSLPSLNYQNKRTMKVEQEQK